MPQKLRTSWIRSAAPGKAGINLVQCDLANHSSWFKDCFDNGWGRVATNAKEVLARKVEGGVAKFPSNPSMAIKEQSGSKIGYWILTAILVVIAVYVYFRK